MSSVEYANPGFFYLLLVIIPMVAWYIWKQRDIHATMQLSSLNGFSKAPKSYKIYFRHLLFALRIFAIIFLGVLKNCLPDFREESCLIIVADPILQGKRQ